MKFCLLESKRTSTIRRKSCKANDFGTEETNWLPDNDSDLSETPDSQDGETMLSKKIKPASNLTPLLKKTPDKYFTDAPISGGDPICLFCNENVGKNSKRTSFHYFVKYHLIKYHVEEFFLDVKDNGIDTSQFARYCQHAVSLEFDQAGPLATGKYFNCPHCKYKCARVSHRAFRTHLIGSHHPILKQKISQLQQQVRSEHPDDLENLLNKIHPIKRINEWSYSKCDYWARFAQTSKQFYKENNCALCQRKTNKSDYRRHLVIFHPETLFSTSGTWKTTDQLKFRRLCAYVLHSQADLAKRVKNSDRHKSKFGFECHICQTTTAKFQQHTCHLAAKHFKVLKEKLNLLEQEDNLDLTELEAQLKNHITIQNRVRNSGKIIGSLCQTYFEKLMAAGKHNCTLCNVKILSKNRRYHFLRNHVERIFSEMKLDNVSEHHFKVCCSEVMSIEIAKAKNSANEKNFKCQYCSKWVLPEKDSAIQDHLMLCHFEILEEHLVRLQTNRFWENEGNSLDDGWQWEPKRKRAKREELEGNSIEGFEDQKSLIVRDGSRRVNDMLTGESENENGFGMEIPAGSVAKTETTEHLDIAGSD